MSNPTPAHDPATSELPAPAPAAPVTPTKPARLSLEEARTAVLKVLLSGRRAVVDLRKNHVPYGNYAKLVRALQTDGLAAVVKGDGDKLRFLEITAKGRQAVEPSDAVTAQAGGAAETTDDQPAATKPAGQGKPRSTTAAAKPARTPAKRGTSKPAAKGGSR